MNEILKEFTYKGYKAYIAQHKEMKHLLGYVVIPKTSLDYTEHDLDVHGGVTFIGYLDHIGRENEHGIGFDCGHAGDDIPAFPQIVGIVRTPEFVEEELKHLIDQLNKKMIRDIFDAEMDHLAEEFNNPNWEYDNF